jgi:hypothetical protein
MNPASGMIQDRKLSFAIREQHLTMLEAGWLDESYATGLCLQIRLIWLLAAGPIRWAISG